MTIFFFFAHGEQQKQRGGGNTQNNFTPKIEGVDYCHFDDVPFTHLQRLRKTLRFGAWAL